VAERRAVGLPVARRVHRAAGVRGGGLDRRSGSGPRGRRARAARSSCGDPRSPARAGAPQRRTGPRASSRSAPARRGSARRADPAGRRRARPGPGC
jgi:hypothetical protein